MFNLYPNVQCYTRNPKRLPHPLFCTCCREDEFQQFQRMMEEQIKEIAGKEAEEAEEEADYREEREAYEQL